MIFDYSSDALAEVLVKTCAKCDLTGIDIPSIENRQENKCRTQFVTKPSPKAQQTLHSKSKVFKKTHKNCNPMLSKSDTNAKFPRHAAKHNTRNAQTLQKHKKNVGGGTDGRTGEFK